MRPHPPGRLEGQFPSGSHILHQWKRDPKMLLRELEIVFHTLEV